MVTYFVCMFNMYSIYNYAFLDPVGIPEFWLTVFKNADLLTDMVKVKHFMKYMQHQISRYIITLPCTVYITQNFGGFGSSLPICQVLSTNNYYHS